MKKIVIGLLLIILFSGTKRKEQYQIIGTIHNIQPMKSRETGSIYIYLLTKSTFQKPYQGIRKVEVVIDKHQEKVEFVIDNVEPGTYGLRCYQDMNNNEELDRFLIIPSEPWCLSWKNNEKSIPPGFEDISFPVHKNVKVDLYLDD